MHGVIPNIESRATVSSMNGNRGTSGGEKDGTSYPAARVIPGWYVARNKRAASTPVFATASVIRPPRRSPSTSMTTAITPRCAACANPNIRYTTAWAEGKAHGVAMSDAKNEAVKMKSVGCARPSNHSGAACLASIAELPEPYTHCSRMVGTVKIAMAPVAGAALMYVAMVKPPGRVGQPYSPKTP